MYEYIFFTIFATITYLTGLEYLPNPWLKTWKEKVVYFPVFIACMALPSGPKIRKHTHILSSLLTQNFFSTRIQFLKC